MSSEEKRLNGLEAASEYREENRGVQAQKQKKYREKNKDKIREQRKAKYHKDVEATRAKAREHYRANRERILECAKKHWQKNKDALKERSDKWHEDVRQFRPWALLLQNAAARAKKKELEFSLTYDWAASRWTGKCELTLISFDLSKKKRFNIYSPSIDRIDNSKGYTPDNCRFILNGVNIFKCADNDADIYNIAEALIMNRRIKPRVPSQS